MIVSVLLKKRGANIGKTIVALKEERANVSKTASIDVFFETRVIISSNPQVFFLHFEGMRLL